jgi:hypothetical protein
LFPSETIVSRIASERRVNAVPRAVFREWASLNVAGENRRSRRATPCRIVADYGMLIRLFGDPVAATRPERRYSPAECSGIEKEIIQGAPDMKHINTSYAERNNLNVRIHTRRITRLTNAFTKKMENHARDGTAFFLVQFCSHS